MSAEWLQHLQLARCAADRAHRAAAVHHLACARGLHQTWPGPAGRPEAPRRVPQAHGDGDDEEGAAAAAGGLTGWLMLASGAAGFDTGPSGSTQAFLEPVHGGGASRRSSGTSRGICSTPWSAPRSPGTRDTHMHVPVCRPLLAGAAWSHEYAGLHHLFSAGTLTALIVPALSHHNDRLP